MKQILIQVDDRLAEQLDEIAPGRSRKRSAFVRRAIARAIQEALERRTREAYERWPDEAGPVDLSAWAPEEEALHPPAPPPQAPAKAKARTASPARRRGRP